VEFIPVPSGSAKRGDIHTGRTSVTVVREILPQHVLQIHLVCPRVIACFGETFKKLDTARCKDDEFKQRMREEMSALREEMAQQGLGNLPAKLEQC
jgi:hypothetical protein